MINTTNCMNNNIKLSIKKSKSENYLYFNKFYKNKLYRTDNSHIFHLVTNKNYLIADNINYCNTNYLISDNIKYWHINHLYLKYDMPIFSSYTTSTPILYGSKEEDIDINYYNEFCSDF